MHFNSPFGLLATLRTALMTTATVTEACWYWVTCEKHISHTRICWSYCGDWIIHLKHGYGIY